MILLIDNYDSFTYNLYQAFCALGARVKVCRNDALTLAGAAALRPESIVLSPGPGRPEEAGICLELVRKFAPKIPVLGVCLGHQTLAQAFGGRVVRAPKMMHGKISRVRHDGHGLFRGLGNPFTAARYHSLMVERRSLPGCFKASAVSEDGVLMAIRHRRWPAEGVQFHPESIMTPEGTRIIKNFLEGYDRRI
ncbi:MAG: aminodeoxychorismate/anthranilate synthase component II [Elusimicrobia bacterium]|nr:aminodeoxychorismate/anthranilate synthase component II [Elusimicrobiota bacterium]